ncbi:MAG: cell division protein SepF [Pseudanabaena sp. M135S2SP2A07QC]|nr:cell division protein SepF [Pseudanabaena sp. M110S1SP2A07QC]MCA6522325.1 cell division protein SepF [Pseudanabaena sp. M051S1SP2A07QC]MCA6527811.1 cell division protein SepF [Pseudanabaena sp. M179S2SP2A07QC]MCA6529643.1 cell division protein SepF [Pseudanabaena sp. M125S2SP2A07QC]MCA6536785.1 cell division protein SepF [Pseudanabaena sp. M176S2SP2A07QC]MCA6541200.1 cell division protein SepF [Pseudanabaena sp. M037S2SP2A07QC]MCA6544500.1 cell division protein SepF [Pseudanabaena sp. M074
MGIFTKLKDFVGLSEAQEYEYEYDEASGREYQDIYQEDNGAIAPEPEEPQARRTRERPTALRATSENMSNVIGMPGAANGLSQVMVMEPRSFEEMPQAIQALRERKSVVLNLTMMDPDQAQRAVDFVAGGTYALDGHQERIGDSIFLFAPSCVQVSSQSSVLNEAPMPQPRVVRSTTAPAPAWASEAPVSRFAQ